MIVTISDLEEYLEEHLAYCTAFEIKDHDTPGIVRVEVEVDHTLIDDIKPYLRSLKSTIQERMPMGIVLEFVEKARGPYR